MVSSRVISTRLASNTFMKMLMAKLMPDDAPDDRQAGPEPRLEDRPASVEHVADGERHARRRAVLSAGAATRIGAEHRDCRGRGRSGAGMSPWVDLRQRFTRSVLVSEQVPRLDFDVAIDQDGRQFLGKHVEGQDPAHPQPGQDALAPVQERRGRGPLIEPQPRRPRPCRPWRTDRGRGERLPAVNAAPIRLRRYSPASWAESSSNRFVIKHDQRTLATALLQLDERAIITRLDHLGKDIVHAMHQPIDPPRAAAGRHVGARPGPKTPASPPGRPGSRRHGPRAAWR